MQAYEKNSFHEADKAFVEASMEEDPSNITILANYLRSKSRLKEQQNQAAFVHQNTRRITQLNIKQMEMIFEAWGGEEFSKALIKAYSVAELRELIMLGIGANRTTLLPVKPGSLNSEMVPFFSKAYESNLI